MLGSVSKCRPCLGGNQQKPGVPGRRISGTNSLQSRQNPYALVCAASLPACSSRVITDCGTSNIRSLRIPQTENADPEGNANGIPVRGRTVPRAYRLEKEAASSTRTLFGPQRSRTVLRINLIPPGTAMLFHTLGETPKPEPRAPRREIRRSLTSDYARFFPELSSGGIK